MKTKHTRVESASINEQDIEEAPTAVDNKKDESRKELEKFQCLESLPECLLLKYPNILLRVFGLYHRKSDKLILKAYPVLMCFVDWFNFARMFWLYEISESLSAELVLKIITTFWLFICSFCASILFFNQEKSDREPKLLGNIFSIFELELMYCRQKKLRNLIYFIYGITFSIAFSNSVAIVVSFFGPKFFYDGFKLFLAPFQNSDWAADNVPYKLMIITSFHWCLSVGVYLSHTVIIIEIQKGFNEEFNKCVTKCVLVTEDSPYVGKLIQSRDETNIFIEFNEKRCVDENQLDKYRIINLKLAYLVELLDNCYREIIGAMVILYIMGIALLLYIISDFFSTWRLKNILVVSFSRYVF